MTVFLTESPVTPRILIHWGAGMFEQAGLAFGHGTDNALDESAALVLHELHIGYDQPDAVLDAELEDADRLRVIALLERRIASRKPAAYLVNEARFAGLSFYVDERVLVPRSPIAELVEAGFAPWIDPRRVHKVLDLCCGSGCIGIACACAFPDARVDMADLSTDALDVADVNIRRHHLEGRVRAMQSNLFSGLKAARYDIIVSNPPYVPRQEVFGLAAEYKHEPALGLVAGSDGLDVVSSILNEAAAYLQDDGILVVEVGDSQQRLVEQYPGVPFLWLEFEYGGEGVFMLESTRLREHAQTFRQVAVERGLPGGDQDEVND
ncbi:MAG: 50S ribosomal protein L3 N(5)-glutamine methyltransferase [Gammaproteobacteria bacterium]|jgi:ribosomal protein L3 glutamine methyltransferase